LSRPRPVAILVTHAALGQELIRTVEAILGPQGDVLFLSNEGRSTERLSDSIDQLVQTLPDDTPVLILADLAAGSCGMAARRAAAQGRTLARITGVNLPMLLEFFHYRDTLPFEDLLARLELKGKAGIVTL
jgi:mannose/fructose-specific phosphotransferase system component IIA